MQKLKLEGMWMVRSRVRWERVIRWLGEDIERKLSVRVLGVWFVYDGGWEEHVRRRMEIV